MDIKELFCPYQNGRGHVCGAHLADYENGTVGSIIVRCRETHDTGKKKLIKFSIDHDAVRYADVTDQPRVYGHVAVLIEDTHG